MTDKDVERRFCEMLDEESPDLWNKIESRLEPKEGKIMKEVNESKKTGFFKKWFGGSSLRVAVSICLVLVLGSGILQMTGGIRMGSSSAKSNSSVYMNSYMDSGSPAVSHAEAGGAVNEAYEADYASDEMSEEANNVYATGATEGATDSSSNVQVQNNSRKLIRYISLDIETMKFDELMADVNKKVEAMGGYVESSSVSGNSYYQNQSRYSSLTIRIPKAKTDEFLNQLGENCNVTSRSESIQDITLTYVDTESHVKALKSEEERLLELMDQADNVEDLMSIESRLSDVRYQLDSYASQLKTFDNQVDYDTVNLYIDEVKEVTPTEKPSIWSRIRTGFADSIQGLIENVTDLFVWVISSLPHIVVLFVVVYLIVVVVKKIGKRKNTK